MDSPQTSTKVRVVVATTVMLSFISFWRAAAIVLADLGSSAYYAGGLAEEVLGLVPEVHVIGDALSPRTAEEAVYEGLKAGCAV